MNTDVINEFHPGDRVEALDVHRGMLGTVIELDDLNEVVWVRVDGIAQPQWFDLWEVKRLAP